MTDPVKREKTNGCEPSALFPALRNTVVHKTGLYCFPGNQWKSVKISEFRAVRPVKTGLKALYSLGLPMVAGCTWEPAARVQIIDFSHFLRSKK